MKESNPAPYPTDVIAEYLSALERELQTIVILPHSAVEPLFGMMRYHLGWADENFRPSEQYAGKRLRPLLCLLVCEVCGGDWGRALPAAAALELMHNFSLIHGDIEDECDTRRGRPTVWRLWGLAQAINVGDAMYALSFRALGRLHGMGVDAHTVCQAQALLQQAALALCQGQYMDLDFEGRLDVDIPLYLEMIEKKPAALIACATEMGALLGGILDD